MNEQPSHDEEVQPVAEDELNESVLEDLSGGAGGGGAAPIGPVH